MKRIFCILLLVLTVVAVGAADKKFILVIDAGHGGHDTGAPGATSYEKNLTLRMSLAFGQMVERNCPDVKVVYTRSTDVFIPLQTRADIANKNNADLFISIHANASPSKEAKGVETFILGTEKMDKNLDVAMRENAVMKLEADYKTTYQGFDPNSIDSYIMFELMQNSFMDQSLQFAEQVQKRFVGHLNRSDRGVQQASFWVLLKTACPSILFEMGFISNPEEERYLNKETSIAQMANALVNAFGAYTHKQAVKKEKLAIDTAAVAAPTPDSQTSQTSQTSQSSGTSKKNAEPTTYYALQVCASRTELAPDDPKLKGLVCEHRKVGDWYKYYAIIDTDRNKVVEKQKEIKKLFPDCWITKFEK